ncbi:MAG TPA: dienelactone hydrolase family protein [Tetrasphaera sp.]|uniref:dienelactone hydrolase family protein n=1 Tax=Nostocoides sp. TaxID=1917966 RepID=UPI002C515512|nr:dienelactone hydrolase family protein [Tetrasphaera sp.]HNQ06410.1 dienelactone hydrolase family protein [Tetrasphaera sp.]
MSGLDGWQRSRFESEGIAHDVYRKGSGPGVIICHEMPGLTTGVIGFGEEVVAAGYTVLLPHLFGPRDVAFSIPRVVAAIPGICISREFTILAVGKTGRIAGWLRALARELHADVGGPGVGALGMCFTGGFALAMMVDAPVIAPVLAQPAAPMPIGSKRAADLGLSATDLDTVRRRAAAGCEVLGVRYASDSSVGTRFATLERELGDRFTSVELEGKGHSTLTEQRQERAVDAVLAFFDQQLRG